jgi:hypothetical protein
LAAGLGLVLALLLALGGAHESSGPQALPLLTRLFISEFGFIVTTAGAVWGFRTRKRPNAEPAALIAALACVTLALAFLLFGLALWSGTVQGIESTVLAPPAATPA